MNRRIALSITFIALNLMACCCGGVGPAKGPKPVAAVATDPPPQVAKTSPIAASDKMQAIVEKYAPILERRPGQNEAEEDARIATAKKKLNDELAVVQAEIDAIAKAAEAKLAAQNAAAEAKLPKVSRANYNKLQENMTLAEAQRILGPGRENAAAGGIQVVTWEGGGLLSTTIISCTFENGLLKARTIVP